MGTNAKTKTQFENWLALILLGMRTYTDEPHIKFSLWLEDPLNGGLKGLKKLCDEGLNFKGVAFGITEGSPVQVMRTSSKEARKWPTLR